MKYDVKKIRITGASKDTYWYAEHIGEVFDVVKTLPRNYVVDASRVDLEGSGWLVGFEDCEPAEIEPCANCSDKNWAECFACLSNNEQMSESDE